MSNVAVALISAAAGALLTAALGYVAWHVRRPAERRDALIEKKMSDRWDASVELRGLLREIYHIFGHLRYPRAFGDPKVQVERGRQNRQEARECARRSIPLLGDEVHDAVIHFTDLSEEAFRRSETGAEVDDLEQPLVDALREANEAIEGALKSLPRP